MFASCRPDDTVVAVLLVGSPVKRVSSFILSYASSDVNSKCCCVVRVVRATYVATYYCT